MLTTNRTLAIAVLVLVSASGHASGQTIIYVDDDAPLGGDGWTWQTAYAYLQDALAVATDGDQIRVAGGAYKPDQDEGGLVTPGDRTESFQLISGVGLYGGYRGCPGGSCADGNADEWNSETYGTILSGDLLGNDVGDADDINDVDDPDRGENSYHVVTSVGVDQTAVLIGFTITAGNANASYGDPNGSGGGMYNSNGSPTVTDCRFRSNTARFGGAGMRNRHSSPTLTNCVFIRNADFNWGAGMENLAGSSPTVTGCKFIGNMARGGAGMYNLDISTAPQVANCLFACNTAVFYGGAGMLNFNGSPTITNCTFSGNTAGGSGGGVSNLRRSSPTVANSIFWGNTDNDGANADESAQIVDHEDAGSAVTYTLVQGLDTFAGMGNIDADPVFVDADGPDDAPGTEDDDLRLLPNSPCIDAGDNSVATVATDLDDLPRIVNGSRGWSAIVDMGAYEYQPDCNDNGVSDALDIVNGASRDRFFGASGGDGIPDECQMQAPIPR